MGNNYHCYGGRSLLHYNGKQIDSLSFGVFGTNAKEPVQLSVVCCQYHRRWHHWHCCLWIVLLATVLIIETSYFTHICICIP